jgi:hypothetical protein
MFFMHESKHKKILLVIIFMTSLLGVGIAIPKLTVTDLVPVSESLRQCADFAGRQQFDNPLERIALLLGKSRITRTEGTNGVEVQSFTLFRIPLGVLRGQPDMKLGVFCSSAGVPNTIKFMNPTPFTDGDEIRGMGQFLDSFVENGVKKYRSEILGLSFNYPDSHLLFENMSKRADGTEYHNLTIAQESTIREAIARIAPTEWPPSINLFFYHEPSLAVSNIVPLDYLEHWVRTHSQSNFVSSDPAQDGILTPTEVAGIPALSYQVAGLYDYNYVAFTYGEWVVLASVAYRDEYTDQDFQTILDSIELSGYQSEKWTTYNASTYNFYFDYPKDSFIETWQDTRFLRIQNYDSQDFSHSISDKYWIEFFALTKTSESSSCPGNIVDYDIIDVDGVTIYKGITRADENSGAGGGLQAICIDQEDFVLYAQGQDGTAENILDRILDSIRF